MNVFKSKEGREKIREYYNNILNVLPLAKRYVDTSYGKTFVLEAGSESNPGIILLHGSCSNSAAWLGDIPALTGAFHVFAVDILGEAGNSEENRLDIHSDDYARWLDEVREALHIEKAVIMGNSMGGWIALKFAEAYPNRTSALVLLAPSGIVLPEESFMTLTADMNGSPACAAAVNEAVMGDEGIPKEVREYMDLVIENFNPITDPLPVLTDAQMGTLAMPVLMIAGTNDITMDSKKAEKRLVKLVPQAKVHLQEGAHVIMSSADTVLRFLTGEK